MFGKMFEWANLARVFGILAITNGGTGAATASEARTNLDVYSKTEIDNKVTGLLNDRGDFDASGGGYPTTGGSGTAGAIKKGDTWKISVSGTIGQVNDWVRALIDGPAQTAANWAISEGNLTETTFGAFVNSLTAKTTPVDADLVSFVDSADSNKSKKISWANIKATLKTYFDTIYGSLSTVNTWTKAQRFAFSTLTDAATVALDLDLANNFNLTLGGNRTLGFPTNIVAGQSGVINVRQDSVGSRNLGFAWCYVSPGSGLPVLSLGKFVMDQLMYVVNSYATAAATISIATPAVVTWNNHGLISGQRVRFTTNGALPTGLAINTTYWVTVVDANTFRLSSSFANLQAGTFIATSGSQSGVHTATHAAITIVINPAMGNNA